jgi:hypothetical protein
VVLHFLPSTNTTDTLIKANHLYLQCCGTIYIGGGMRNTAHMHAIGSHAWQRVKRNKRVNPDGIFERKFLFENENRTDCRPRRTTGTGTPPAPRFAPLDAIPPTAAAALAFRPCSGV